ncbi:MAG TPA: DNA polymerase III subunit delta [Bacteroidales bacterium]|nr:DNA polymerase III subunit delta [Bacteroidales bacterium]HPT02529.1 DNA polymerase III subunit delta [Bacteroidales bacterium]
MKFSEIIGQEPVKARLLQSVKENRVSHAQLFLGPEGSGKLAMAIAYAQYINCRQRTETDSCGTCPSCVKYSKLIHPDLHFLYPINKTKEVDKEPLSIDFLPQWREFLSENFSYVSLQDWYEKIGIEKKQGIINADDANYVIKALNLKSYEAEYKIVIIWMAEKLFHAAAPKLLKSIEEPADKTVFILVSENPDSIPQTILSRTQLVKLNRTGDDAVAEFLEDKLNLDASEASSIALVADGNAKEALDMARLSSEQQTTGKGDSANPKSDPDRERFGLFREWMRRCWVITDSRIMLKDYNLLQETVASIVSDGSREKQKDFLAYGLKMLRSCLHYNMGNRHLVKHAPYEMEFIANFSRYIHIRNIQSFDEEFNQAIFHIERNAAGNLIFTDLSHIVARLLKIAPPPQR